MIKDKEFSRLNSVGHAFFTRQGGISKGVYDSLNCCFKGNDNPKHVTENRRMAVEQLKFPLQAIRSVEMVHGDAVLVVNQSWQNHNQFQADAMVTNQKHLILATDSADCPIVLLADVQAKVIGLAHAGWRSAKIGIIEKTIEHMILLGANKNHISAVIGPCITQDSYEVDSNFYQQFLLERDENQTYFEPSKNYGHHMFNLPNYVKDRLSQLKLQSISTINLDTYTNEDLFFSCRRACHRKENDFGGHLSCIFLNE